MCVYTLKIDLNVSIVWLRVQRSNYRHRRLSGRGSKWVVTATIVCKRSRSRRRRRWSAIQSMSDWFAYVKKKCMGNLLYLDEIDIISLCLKCEKYGDCANDIYKLHIIWMLIIGIPTSTLSWTYSSMIRWWNIGSYKSRRTEPKKCIKAKK